MAKKLFKCRQSKIGLAFLLTLFMSVSVFAQDKYTLTGVVTLASLNQPASGVSVIVKGTDVGTVTDFDGNYAIEVSPGDVLEFVYLGFKTENVIVGGQQTANVSLQDDTTKLDEIVVVGYGTQKAKNVTSSVSKVSGKIVENAPVARVDDALKGKIAGVNIVNSVTEVGGDTRITIRGTGSISGTSAPLIVIDGVPIGTEPDILSGIDSNNIESIEVLKDASSVAIYGSRGANGVIIVTLKKGITGDTRFSYNAYTGIRYATENDNFNLSISEEEARIDAIANTLDTSSELYSDYLTTKSELTVHKIIADAIGGETNWQEYVIPGGLVNSHSFAARGGNELTKFAASVGYIHDEGIYIKDDLKRYNARVRIDSRSKNKKLKYGLRVNGQHVDQVRIPSRFTDALRQRSSLPVFITEEFLQYVPQDVPDGFAFPSTLTIDEVLLGTAAFESANDNYFVRNDFGGIVLNEDGTPYLSLEDGNIDVSSTNNLGPASYFEFRNRTKEQSKVYATTYLEYKLAKGLKFKQSVSGDFRETGSSFYQSYLGDNDGIETSERSFSSDVTTHINVESLLTYKRDLKRHGIDALAGFTYDNYDYKFINLGVTGAFGDDFTSNITNADAIESPDAFTLLGQEKLASYFGRLNYAFDDKYLLSVSARADASSRFGSQNRLGFFPAASIGWRVSGENFMKNSDVITDLKLRASYGVSGSNDIDSNKYNSLYRSQSLATTIDYGGISGKKLVNLGYDSLGWEKLIELNYGGELELFNGVIGLTADYYTKKSEDLILELTIPTVIGASSQLQNIGQVQNSGYEFELRSRLVDNGNFSWNVSGQFSTNKNEVLDLGGADQIINTADSASRPVQWITELGGPISAFYGYVMDGELPLEAWDPFARYGAKSQQVYARDINGDGVIDEDDRTVLGSPYADFEWGLSSDFQIHDFDINFSLQGSHGAERRVGDLGQLEYSDDSSTSTLNTFEDLELLVNRQLTDYQIQDASFIALRNVSLGYTIPKNMIDNIGLTKLRFYVSGENLAYLTADGYTGFNPEAAGQTSEGTNTPVTYGYQRGDGPITRTVTIGLNVEF